MQIAMWQGKPETIRSFKLLMPPASHSSLFTQAASLSSQNQATKAEKSLQAAQPGQASSCPAESEPHSHDDGLRLPSCMGWGKWQRATRDKNCCLLLGSPWTTFAASSSRACPVTMKGLASGSRDQFLPRHTQKRDQARADVKPG